MFSAFDIQTIQSSLREIAGRVQSFMATLVRHFIMFWLKLHLASKILRQSKLCRILLILLEANVLLKQTQMVLDLRKGIILTEAY